MQEATLKTHQRTSLADWLQYLESIGFSERLSIEDVALILNKLNIKKDFFLITVTGTNGKGSTCHLLERILYDNGYNVGLFTSPHLITYNERFRVNANQLDDHEILNSLNKVEKAVTELGFSCGYFTYTFLAACLCFSKYPLDFIILEVGCGGRLDPSNAFDADITVITSIGLDHKDLLGDTLGKIALEKSALARENKPVVIGELNFPKEAGAYLKNKGAQIVQINKAQLEEYSLKWGEYTPLFLHQNNMASVIKITELLNRLNYHISDAKIKSALMSFKLNGRNQKLSIKGKTVIFDVGHNQQSVIYLMNWLNQHFDNKSISAIYSSLKTKSVDEIVEVAGPLISKWSLTSLEGIDNRAMLSSELTSYFDTCTYLFIKDPVNAFETTLEQLDENEVLVVFGSFILVAMLLAYCHEKGYIQ